MFWSLVFPIIKLLWTSSFVLMGGGYGFLLLALFYWIIDVSCDGTRHPAQGGDEFCLRAFFLPALPALPTLPAFLLGPPGAAGCSFSTS